jgi:hypothetical protein
MDFDTHEIQTIKESMEMLSRTAASRATHATPETAMMTAACATHSIPAIPQISAAASPLTTPPPAPLTSTVKHELQHLILTSAIKTMPLLESQSTSAPIAAAAPTEETLDAPLMPSSPPSTQPIHTQPIHTGKHLTKARCTGFYCN